MHEVRADKLKGIVEVDETYIGGKTRSKNRFKNKACVVGAIERDGQIRLQVIKAPNRYLLHKFIKQNTDPKTEAIYTDEFFSYRGIDDADTRHETVKHGDEEWVRGDVHTNNVENGRLTSPSRGTLYQRDNPRQSTVPQLGRHCPCDGTRRELWQLGCFG